MRTTLTLDDDILLAARSLAQRENTTIGNIVSRLTRQALRTAAPAAHRNGVPLLVRSEPVEPVTMELINRLRDELL